MWAPFRLSATPSQLARASPRAVGPFQVHEVQKASTPLLLAQPPLQRFIHGCPIVLQAAHPNNRDAPEARSKFVGVSWDRSTKKWRSQKLVDGKVKFLGFYEDEVEAARAFDVAAGPLGRQVNFPGRGQKKAVKQGAHGIVSKFTGVHWHVAKKKWEAGIAVDGQKKHLGAFEDEEEAARVFDEAAGLLGRPVNFPGPGQKQAVKRGIHVFYSR